MPKKVRVFVAAVAAVILTACGGGGSGGNDPVTMSADMDTTIKAGDSFSFTVVASSPDNALSKLGWTMQASTGAPDLSVRNLDCSTIEKTDTPRQNGLVSSVWKCTISGAAPALVAKDATYSFTASASNVTQHTSSVSSALKVTATPSGTLVPVVEIDGPHKVAGGSVNDLSCFASGGFVTPGKTPIYTYAWSSSSLGGQQVSFDNRRGQKVKATVPKLPSNSVLIVTCEATDEMGNVGLASAPIEVMATTPEVSISGTAAGMSGETIALECKVADDTGSSTLKYKWTSVPVNGAALTFSPADHKMVSVTLPSVKKPTSIVATCEVTDGLGAAGYASKAVEITPEPEPPTPPASGASGV